MRFKTFVALFALTASPALAATQPSGVKRLSELAVVPTFDLTYRWNWSSRVTLRELEQDLTLEECLQQAKAAVAAEPENPRRHIELGELWSRNENATQASSSYQAALKLCRIKVDSHPNDPLAQLELGDALSGCEKSDEALAAYRRAVQAGTNEWRCWMTLGRYLASRSLDAVLPPGASYEEGQFRGLSSNFRPSADAMDRSRVALDEATQCHERATAIAPDEPELLLERALFCQASDLARALQNSFRRLETLDPALLRKGFFSSNAVPLFEQLAILRPKAYRLLGLAIWFEWVSVQLEHGMTESSGVSLNALPQPTQVRIRALMRQLDALGEDPNPKIAAGALESLAADDMKIGRLGLARVNAKRSVTLDPSRDMAWDLMLGLSVIDGNPEELTEVCEKRLKHRDNPHNRLLFSKSLYREGKFSRAEEEARVALARDTDSVAAHVMAAATIIRQGKDLQPVLKLLHHAMQLVRDMPDKEEKSRRFRECVLNIAILSAIAGKTDEAKEMLQQVIRQNPDDEQAKEILSAIP